MSRFCFLTLLVSTFLQTTTAIYNLAQDYSGDSFFQGWDFFTDADPTNGHVLYQSQVDANSKGLIKVQNNGLNSSKQIFIGVDSSNQTPAGRPSVRISTQKTFQHALVLADIAHQPGGICGVWPAFWMVGANWPQQGEIDIVEGVSTQATNQMTLHTDAGPVLDHTARFSGKLLTPDCDVNAPNQDKNVGCGIADTSNATFGNDFNTIGGGVFATEWTSQFIKIWFFPRNKIPADVSNGIPTPSQSWGTPRSVFQGAFSMDDHFKDLSIVLNTAFCGDWAGAIWDQTPECKALAPTCNDYVTKNFGDFQEAFWLVNSIKVFQDDGTNAAPSPSASAITATATSAPTSPPIAPPPTTSTRATKSTSTVTITQTFTIYPTVTPLPESMNITAPPDFRGPHPEGDSNIKAPDMMFNQSKSDKDKWAYRSGGAVLPLNFLKNKFRL